MVGPRANCPQNLVRAHIIRRPRAQMAPENVVVKYYVSHYSKRYLRPLLHVTGLLKWLIQLSCSHAEMSSNQEVLECYLSLRVWIIADE